MQFLTNYSKIKNMISIDLFLNLLKKFNKSFQQFGKVSNPSMNTISKQNTINFSDSPPLSG